MKIVFLLQASSVVLRGGSEVQADYIIREILKRGHEIVFISDLIREESGPRLEGVEYLFLKSRGTRHSYKNAGALLKILDRIDPDVIYNRWRIPYSGIAAWYARRRGKKFVLGMASAKDVLKNPVAVNRALVPNWISEHLGRYGLRHADLLIAQNREQQDALRRHFGRESVLISSGHPVPEGPFPKETVPTAIWVANIKPLKQIEVFFDLARALEKTPARFVCVGRPDMGRYQEKIDRMSRGRPNVTMAGELDQDATNALIASAWVLVNTSLHEGNPNTFVQAWMRETPVVSLNCDPDGVLEGRGIGFHARTFDRLVESTRLLLENREERDRRGRTAREHAVRHHEIGAVGAAYAAVFEGLTTKG